MVINDKEKENNVAGNMVELNSASENISTNMVEQNSDSENINENMVEQEHPVQNKNNKPAKKSKKEQSQIKEEEVLPYDMDEEERRKYIKAKSQAVVNGINSILEKSKKSENLFINDHIAILAKDIQQIEFLKTGIFEFDSAMGGIPLGKCILIYGRESSCKTTFALQCAKQSANMGFKPVIIETENTFNPSWAKQIMGDTFNDLILIDNNFDADIYNSIIKIISSNITNLIVIDTIANIVTQREKSKIIAGEITDDLMTEKARSINKLLNALPALLRNRKIGIIFINQARDVLNAPVPSLTFGGGHELRHLGVSIIQMRSVSFADSALGNAYSIDKDRQYIRFSFEKSKIGNQEGLKIYSHFIRKHGFDHISDIVDNLIKTAIVEQKRGGFYEFRNNNNEIESVHGLEAFKKRLLEDKELYETLYVILEQKFREQNNIVIIK